MQISIESITILTYIIVVIIGVCASSLIMFNFARQALARFSKRKIASEDEDGDGPHDVDTNAPEL